MAQAERRVPAPCQGTELAVELLDLVSEDAASDEVDQQAPIATVDELSITMLIIFGTPTRSAHGRGTPQLPGSSTGGVFTRRWSARSAACSLRRYCTRWAGDHHHQLPQHAPAPGDDWLACPTPSPVCYGWMRSAARPRTAQRHWPKPMARGTRANELQGRALPGRTSPKSPRYWPRRDSWK